MASEHWAEEHLARYHGDMSFRSTELPTSAAVVIIGGGVMGLSCAYHLARAGVSDVVLLERNLLGTGSTGLSAGGVRTQFSDRVNIEISARSMETFRDFPNRFDQEIDFHDVGYLFLLSTSDSVNEFEKGVALQNELGLPNRIISVTEAKRLSPMIETDGLLAAAFSPTDGHCAPDSVVLGYATAARRIGARLFTRTEVTGIEVRNNEVEAVDTSCGRIRTQTVICTAGAWSQQVGAWVGINLPVSPLRRQIMVTEPIPNLDPATPFTIDFETTFYFHGSGPSILFGMSDPDERPGFTTDIADAWLPRLGDAIGRRAPFLSSVGIATGWAGLYEVTPDNNALIGEVEGVSRFLYATGFSGHGFLMGPAIGEIVRDIYLDQQPFVDVSGFDVRRFQAHANRPELNIV
jgi:sarcosine oxidase subunit beta